MQMLMGEGVAVGSKLIGCLLQTGGRKERADHFVAVAHEKFTHGSPTSESVVRTPSCVATIPC
ncbi:Uncharacterised protein [Escherichia coli]|uniref:Uncharacterized protein n=1 Tax=Escherichia coli TaxID=562 RepID=A0A377DA29_ECOLX|nr:Uncharacterised protein [Escherichia coli]